MKKDKKLEAIIKEFGDAMRNAHPPFIAHEAGDRFTLHMQTAWAEYREHMAIVCDKKFGCERSVAQ